MLAPHQSTPIACRDEMRSATASGYRLETTAIAATMTSENTTEPGDTSGLRTSPPEQDAQELVKRGCR